MNGMIFKAKSTMDKTVIRIQDNNKQSTIISKVSSGVQRNYTVL